MFSVNVSKCRFPICSWDSHNKEPKSIIFGLSKRLKKSKCSVFEPFSNSYERKKHICQMFSKDVSNYRVSMLLEHNRTKSHNSDIFGLSEYFKSSKWSTFHPLSNRVKPKEHSCQMFPQDVPKSRFPIMFLRHRTTNICNSVIFGLSEGLKT